MEPWDTPLEISFSFIKIVQFSIQVSSIQLTSMSGVQGQMPNALLDEDKLSGVVQL